MSNCLQPAPDTVMTIRASVEIERQSFHPIVLDWMESKGNVYDLNVYDGHVEALTACWKPIICCHRVQLFNPPCEFERGEPKMAEFVTGEAKARRPVDILLEALGARHLLSADPETRPQVLEVDGAVPEISAEEVARDGPSKDEEADLGVARSGQR
ncbi:hypothetical protein LTR37_016363 [Vermiconidia calcicola]|uniref:Uncharacterized protein n=1 Tax=Vermiconidia calcicola TaxID=1690605 RepID=A0ACC3MPM8_9PEZI|nr:hypothetical protein LTR37_016363 [Vermiconidia calcicola]